MQRLLATSAAVLLAALGTRASAQAEAPPAGVSAEHIVQQVCAACHGARGNSAAPEYPVLAGQVSSYLYEQLRDLAAQGQRPEAGVMGAFALGLDDAQMRNVADYFARQPVASPRQDVVAEPNPEGESIFFEGVAKAGVPACASCHGTAGTGLAPSFPRIAGQHAEYLATQLRRYREGTRITDQGALMRQVAQGLSDQEIDAVARFAARMRGG